MDLFAFIICVIVALYPLILIWRFLHLGIKAFKKYLSEKPTQQNYYFEQPDYEGDDE